MAKSILNQYRADICKAMASAMAGKPATRFGPEFKKGQCSFDSLRSMDVGAAWKQCWGVSQMMVEDCNVSRSDQDCSRFTGAKKKGCEEAALEGGVPSDLVLKPEPIRGKFSNFNLENCDLGELVIKKWDDKNNVATIELPVRILEIKYELEIDTLNCQKKIVASKGLGIKIQAANDEVPNIQIRLKVDPSAKVTDAFLIEKGSARLTIPNGGVTTNINGVEGLSVAGLSEEGFKHCNQYSDADAVFNNCLEKFLKSKANKMGFYSLTAFFAYIEANNILERTNQNPIMNKFVESIVNSTKGLTNLSEVYPRWRETLTNIGVDQEAVGEAFNKVNLTSLEDKMNESVADLNSRHDVTTSIPGIHMQDIVDYGVQETQIEGIKDDLCRFLSTMTKRSNKSLSNKPPTHLYTSLFNSSFDKKIKQTLNGFSKTKSESNRELIAQLQNDVFQVQREMLSNIHRLGQSGKSMQKLNNDFKKLQQFTKNLNSINTKILKRTQKDNFEMKAALVLNSADQVNRGIASVGAIKFSVESSSLLCHPTRQMIAPQASWQQKSDALLVLNPEALANFFTKLLKHAMESQAGMDFCIAKGSSVTCQKNNGSSIAINAGPEAVWDSKREKFLIKIRDFNVSDSILKGIIPIEIKNGDLEFYAEPKACNGNLCLKVSSPKVEMTRMLPFMVLNGLVESQIEDAVLASAQSLSQNGLELSEHVQINSIKSSSSQIEVGLKFDQKPSTFQSVCTSKNLK